MLHGWCHVECCRFGAGSVYSIQPCTRLQCHFIQSHTGRVYVCLAVTCHLHFWQNDRDLVCATAVTRGWNGYQNESAQKADPRKENCSCGDLNSRLFCYESGGPLASFRCAGRTDEQTDRQTNSQTDGQTEDNEEGELLSGTASVP